MGNDLKTLLWAAFLMGMVALLATLFSGCCSSPTPKGYTATLRIWRCGELIQETITEETTKELNCEEME